MIPIIDLFAGPGGLGEGFMSLTDDKGKPLFDIRLSIEKDENAHKTLTLRSFFRQFKKKGKAVPRKYYEAIEEKNLKKREELIEIMLDSFPEGKEAKIEARLVELGSKEWPAEKVDRLIQDRLGKNTKNWVLIGGPPCQAYSNVGRSRVGGIDPDDHRVYLYKEYLRIIEKHNPTVFVMENVQGLLSAKVGEEKVFDWMKKDLQVNGMYTIHSLVKPVENDKDFLIRAEEYGVPQKRHRVILLGIRSDFKHQGQYLSRKEQVKLKSVIGLLPKIRSGINRSFKKYHPYEKYQNGSPKRLYENIPDSDEKWLDLISTQILKLRIWGDMPLNGLSKGPIKYSNGTGSEYVECKKSIEDNHPLKSWFLDPELNGLPNHESRAHLTQDLMRYMFAGLYVEKNGTFPKLEDYAKHHSDLIPDHANVKSGKFTDRFRVQVADQPATTVTSHISKDGHYFIHYDPKQCRSLTVREAARIQTFPDNYLFRGSRTQQFHQVGNAVPPYLAFQIAKIVKEVLKN
ncbi:DNA cytosine methyltransferase [Algoriphagus formosus]|uniref:DNA (cytosine-5-)-methyltransferase n=1 Tax=Algoriphagus formosus TaxID=2007308 RepID=A0A4R5UUG3_9BACT|nr:DNA cytosine methyltransferase [Algoriphagus aquimaris]TDK42838.1 DNA cytosine methyltransferase [Algoriphagus aquimaris]